jgi:hypothetical protein
LSTKLKENVHTITPLYSDIVAQTQATQTQFEALKETYDTISQSNLSKLNRIGIEFEDRLQEITEGSSIASEAIARAASNLQSTTNVIEQAAQNAKN